MSIIDHEEIIPREDETQSNVSTKPLHSNEEFWNEIEEIRQLQSDSDESTYEEDDYILQENMNLLDVNNYIFSDEERDDYVLEYLLNEPGQNQTKIVCMRCGAWYILLYAPLMI